MQGPTPTLDEWLRLYFARHHRSTASQRVVTALFESLVEGGEQPGGAREVARVARVSHMTAARVVDRLRQLGLVRTSGRVWFPERGSGLPAQLRIVWPPDPPDSAAVPPEMARPPWD